MRLNFQRDANGWHLHVLELGDGETQDNLDIRVEDDEIEVNFSSCDLPPSEEDPDDDLPPSEEDPDDNAAASTTTNPPPPNDPPDDLPPSEEDPDDP